MHSCGDFPSLGLPIAAAGITLVRPDGYIAYATENGYGVSVFAELQSVVGRQLNEPNSMAFRSMGTFAAG
jgi:hypothetical protein